MAAFDSCAACRAGPDGRLYYDVVLRLQSYASRAQLAVNAAQREGAVVQEYDRALGTTLGVANGRLYELRWQAPMARYERDARTIRDICASFQLTDVDA